MEEISSLEELKEQLSKTGKELQRKNCIWADHYAVQNISNFFGVCFLIFNEQNTISTTKINPTTKETKNYILLYLTKRNHYNLVGWKQSNSITQYFFTINDLPQVIKTAFELPGGEKQTKLQFTQKSNSNLTNTQNKIKNKNDNNFEIILENLEGFDLLPDKILKDIFFSYFTENERKYILSNVCDRWGRIIWGHFCIPSFVITNKKQTKNSNSKSKIDLNRPAHYFSKIQERVPHIRSLIYSVEIDHFERGWMEDLVSLPFLKEFYFYYGNIRKFHLPNPDLKLLVKEKINSLEVLKIQPQRGVQNILPIKFNNCGFNAIKRCKRLHTICLCIFSDAKNTFVSSIPSTVKHLELYEALVSYN